MPVYYCTPTDIRDNVGGTDEGTGTCAQLEDEQLTEAIGKASSRISATTGTVYEPDASDPAGTVPDLVADLTIALATFYATLTYRKNLAVPVTDPAWLAYQDALTTLKGIQAGQITVDPQPPGEGPGADAAARVINTIPRIFTGADAGVERTLRGGIEAERGPGRGLPWR
jgi:hypothetical protein